MSEGNMWYNEYLIANAKVAAYATENERLREEVKKLLEIHKMQMDAIERMAHPPWGLGQTSAENERLRSLLRWFCDRVERGEVRSKTTYAVFKAALEN